jgi:hypothetical protein
MSKIAKIVSKMFEWYLWIHVVYFLLMIASLIYAAYHIRYLHQKVAYLPYEFEIWFFENLFFFIASYTYLIIYSIKHGDTIKKGFIINLIIINIFNLLSIILFSDIPDGLVYLPLG